MVITLNARESKIVLFSFPFSFLFLALFAIATAIKDPVDFMWDLYQNKR